MRWRRGRFRARTPRALAAVGALLAVAAGHAAADAPSAQAAGEVRWRTLDEGPSAAQRASRAATLDFPFSTRADEEPAGARVTIAFGSSAPPAGRARALEVRVNDGRVASLTVQPGSQATVSVPDRLLAARNLLSLRWLDPGGGAVEHPADAWRALASVRIFQGSSPSPLPDDLALLPLPFVDPDFDAEARVAIVSPAPMDAEHLRDAALVASWLALDTPVPLSFVTSAGDLPDSRAVVLVDSEADADRLGLAPITGPLVRMVDHPRHPGSNLKLLVVAGRSVAELRVAAEALAARTERLVGAELRLAPAPPASPAAPYSAPRWLPPGRRVSFKEYPLGGTPAHGGVTSATLPVRFRIAPDLSIWPADSVVLDLGWAARLPPGVPPPRLDLELNGYFIATLPPPRGSVEQTRWVRLRIPREHLRGYNALLLHVSYPPPAARAPAAAAAHVAISGDSVLHLERFPHFATMPDVALFAYDGFPFTRVPDLGETAVVLPAHPSQAELSTAVTLLAQFAQITGRAPSRVRLAMGDAPRELLAGRDLLLVGSASDHPLIVRWRDRWPAALGPGAAGVRAPGGASVALELTSGIGEALDRHRAREVLARAGLAGAIMEIESPVSPGRSAVAVTAADAGLPPFRQFLGFAETRNLRGDDLLVLSGGRRWMFHVGPSFTRGHLAPADRVRWFLASHWALLVPLAALAAAVLAQASGRAMARRMRERLAFTGERT